MKIDVSQGALVSKDATLKLSAPLHKSQDQDDLDELDVTIRVGANTIFHPSSSLTIIMHSKIANDNPIILEIGSNNVFDDQCRITIDLNNDGEEGPEKDTLIIGEGNFFESMSHVRCRSISSFNVFGARSRVQVNNILDGCVITPAMIYSGDRLESEVVFYVNKGWYIRKHVNGKERNQKEIIAYVLSMKDVITKHHALL